MKNTARLALLVITLAAFSSIVIAQHARQAESPNVYQENIANYIQRDLRGWTVHIHRDLAKKEQKLLKRTLFQLEYDLANMEYFLAKPQLNQLKNVHIWIELQGAAVPDGMSGRGMCYHPSKQWLTSHGLLAEKTDGVEIVRAADFPGWRINQPYMTFHEFAHAYHNRFGHDNPEVAKVYRQAMKERLYDAVDYNVAEDGRPVRAYAANNPIEYFAEISEAYFGLNDYFPFTRSQLRRHDPRGYELVERLWSLSTEELKQSMQAIERRHTPKRKND